MEDVDTLADLTVVKGQPLESEFVVVVAFRNQQQRIARCLKSIRDCAPAAGVVIIDDGSRDGSLDCVLDFYAHSEDSVVIVSNLTQKYFPRNLYNAVHLLVTNPEAIIIEVDGDDYLAHKEVLSILRGYYARGIRQTFGSFKLLPSSDRVWNGQLEGAHEKTDASRPWDLRRCAAWLHLKTYRKSLFEAVPLKHFKERHSDRWIRTAEDLCVHPKMMELAKGKVAFIQETLYVYDVSSSEHDQHSIGRDRYILENLYRIPRSTYFEKAARRLCIDRVFGP